MSLISEEQFAEWRAKLVSIEEEAGAEMFMRLPDRWYEEGPTWGCQNGHVSHMYIKSEEKGALCQECMTPVWLICPEFKSDEQLATALDLYGTTIGATHDQ